MGLDMYLMKRTDVKNWSFQKETYEVEVMRDGESVEHIQKSRVSGIIEEVGQWRKANHIHKWFVENCQEGVDNCREAYVDKEKLLELKDECEKMMLYLNTCTKKEIKVEIGYRYNDGERETICADKTVFEIDESKITLPTSEGFFFGSTEYEQWYYDDLKDTSDIIYRAMLDVREDDYNVTFSYISSW